MFFDYLRFPLERFTEGGQNFDKEIDLCKAAAAMYATAKESGGKARGLGPSPSVWTNIHR